MFWKESAENDITLEYYDKGIYLNTNKNQNKNSSENKDTLDMSDVFKEGMTCLSDWGLVKITSVNKDERKCKVSIGGQNTDLTFDELDPFYNLYILCYSKNKDGEEKKVWMQLKFLPTDNPNSIRTKISNMYNTKPKNVILVSNGAKITNFDRNFFDSGITQKSCILALVKGQNDF